MESKILFFINYMMTVKRASKNTLESYKRDLEAMKEYFYSQNIVDIEKITGTSINSYVLHLEKIGKSPATIARTVSTIKTFFRCMINNGYVKREPTENINVPQQDKGKTRTELISQQDIEKILSAIKGDDGLARRDRAMIRLMYDTGLKVSCIIELKVQDINLQYSYVTSRSGKKDKTVPFGEKVRNAVEEYLNEGRSKLVNSEEDKGFLFVNYVGKHMTRQGFWKIFKAYAKMAGIEDVNTQGVHK